MNLRSWVSFFTVYPLQVLASLVIQMFSWTSRLCAHLVRGTTTHLYIPIMRARRWVAGEPGYKPEDTVYLGMQPRNADDKKLLEGWAKANGRMVFESMDGQVFVVPACSHDHDGPCSVSLTPLNEEEIKAANAMATDLDGGTSLEVDEKTGALRVVKHPPKTAAGEIDTGDHDDRPRAA